VRAWKWPASKTKEVTMIDELFTKAAAALPAAETEAATHKGRGGSATHRRDSAADLLHMAEPAIIDSIWDCGWSAREVSPHVDRTVISDVRVS
jgi:hypothetical protein